MTPLPVNPNVVVLVQDGKLVADAGNVFELDVTVVTDKAVFDELAKGKTFANSFAN